MSDKPVLELEAVTKVYGEEPPVPALRGVSFSVRSGGIASAILIGAVAGLMPAVRASRMTPTVALRTV
jgi:hypothetical protein